MPFLQNCCPGSVNIVINPVQIGVIASGEPVIGELDIVRRERLDVDARAAEKA